MKKKIWMMIIFLMAFALLAACSGNNDKENAEGSLEPAVSETPGNSAAPKSPAEPTVPTEPVTLSIYVDIGGFPDPDFEAIIAKPLKEKFPYITLNLLRPGAGVSLPERVVSGELPDMILGPIITTNYYLNEINLVEDLTPWVKKYQMDLNRFDPTYVQIIRDEGDDPNTLYSIPFSNNSYALWYNIDIFDKFSISYPTDGMTWGETIELAKQVTRPADDKNYRGLDIFNNNSIWDFASAYALPLVDAETNRAIISDKWGDLFRLAMEVYNIPGNRPAKLPGNELPNSFLRTQDLAMAPYFSNGMIGNLVQAESLNLNWDVVQTPSHDELPNIGYGVGVQSLFMTKTSKHQDLVFQVIDFLTSNEVQLIASKRGKPPVLADQSLRNQFAADLPHVQGKNIQAIFKNGPGGSPPFSKHNRTVINALDAAFLDVYNGNTDINSALRRAEEVANVEISKNQ